MLISVTQITARRPAPIATILTLYLLWQLQKGLITVVYTVSVHAVCRWLYDVFD